MRVALDHMQALRGGQPPQTVASACEPEMKQQFATLQATRAGQVVSPWPSRNVTGQIRKVENCWRSASGVCTLPALLDVQKSPSAADF